MEEENVNTGTEDPNLGGADLMQGGDGGNAAVETPPVLEPTPYEIIGKKLGLTEFSEEAIVNRFTQLQGETAQERQARETLENRQKGISPMLFALQEKMAENGFQGTDDELLDFVSSEISQSRIDYAGMASSNPLDVIARGLKLSNPSMTDSVAKMDAYNMSKSIKDYAAEYVTETNPEATQDDIDAMYKTLLADKAKAYVPSLEASRPKFTVRPESVESPEAVAAKQAAQQKAVNDSYESALRGFKGLDVGGQPWEVKLLNDAGDDIMPGMEDVARFAANPFAVLTDPNTGLVNHKLALELAVLYYQRGDILAAKTKAAADAAAIAQENKVLNVNQNGQQSVQRTPSENPDSGTKVNIPLIRGLS